MNAKKILIILLLAICIISCKKTSEPYVDTSNALYGNWINPIINDSIITFAKSVKLTENEYGFIFKENRQFIERNNSGWCGTPPVSFTDFDGLWTEKDSIINITVKYWGGLADYQWKIISLNNSHLAIYKIKVTYRNK